MYDFKIGMVNHALVKAVQLIGCCRRMVDRKSDVYADLTDIDREVREAARECQRVLDLIEADVNRPLVTEGAEQSVDP